MNEFSALLQQKQELNSNAVAGADQGGAPQGRRLEARVRLVCGLAFAVIAAVVFGRALFALGIHAAHSDVHSHILLIPLISGYLIYLRREQFPTEFRCSAGLATIALLISLSSLGAAHILRGFHAISQNDYLGLMALGFVSFLVSAGLFLLGWRWIKQVAFPLAFLLFMIPLPDGAVDLLETGSKLASAEAANLFFELTATPILRDGTIFQLPGIVIEVAQECSGIRSSWVLFITSILASNLFLSSPWRRTALVAFVIPLGIIRNGFRILVIGLLCVHIGPHMIHSVIHRRGGPLFFSLSLVPLFLFLWWLRRGEHPAVGRSRSQEGFRSG